MSKVHTKVDYPLSKMFGTRKALEFRNMLDLGIFT